MLMGILHLVVNIISIMVLSVMIVMPKQRLGWLRCKLPKNRKQQKKLDDAAEVHRYSALMVPIGVLKSLLPYTT